MQAHAARRGHTVEGNDKVQGVAAAGQCLGPGQVKLSTASTASTTSTASSSRGAGGWRQRAHGTWATAVVAGVRRHVGEGRGDLLLVVLCLCLAIGRYGHVTVVIVVVCRTSTTFLLHPPAFGN